MFQKVLWVLFVVVVLAACGGAERAPAVAFPDSLVDDELIVTVNSEDVFGRDLKVFTLVYRPTTIDSIYSRMFNLQLLNGYVDRVILHQEARASGISVKDSTVQWYVENFTRALGGPQRLQGFLDMVGVTSGDLEQTIRRDLLARSYIEGTLARDVRVDRAEAETYFDNNPQFFELPDSAHARHIILRSTPDETEEQKAEKYAKLRSWRDRARKGESFAELARQYSEGPSAPNGGDLGYFTYDSMVPEFSEVAFNMKPGDVSDVVETSFGYHIIYLEDMKSAHKLTFQEVADDLMRQMRQRDVNTLVENHLKRTRATAIIEANFDFGGLTQRESATFTR